MANVLLLYHFDSYSLASSFRQNVEAFRLYSRHQFFPLDTIWHGLAGVELSRFDAVLLHWSLVLSPEFRGNYLGKDGFGRLVDFDGAKFVMLQDEYRWISHSIEAIRALKAKAHFTALWMEDAKRVYDDPRMADTELVSVLTGYLDPALPQRAVKSHGERSIDIGYRGRDLTGENAWLGELSQEKTWICERMLADPRARSLRLNLSNSYEDRLMGEAWFEFIAECKAMLGTESGASMCDFDDSIRRKVLAYAREHPQASFQEVRDACFPGLDWKTPARGLSPRSLEAAALRTLMVNYEGVYHGILEPWTHYVPLKKDHSNFEEVAAVIRDPAAAAKIIQRAYDDVGANPAYQYPAFVEIVDRTIEKHTAGRRMVRAGYDPQLFEVMIALKAELGKASGNPDVLAARRDVSKLLVSEASQKHKLKKIFVDQKRILDRMREDRLIVERFIRHQRILIYVLAFLLLLVAVFLWRALSD